MQVPFTTGILAGIGETEAERLETLEEIAQIATKYGLSLSLSLSLSLCVCVCVCVCVCARARARVCD